MRGWKLRGLANKMFSSITACLHIMGDGYQTLFVFHNQIIARSEHRTSTSRGTSGGFLKQSWPVPTISLLTLWEVFSLKFTIIARSFLGHALKFHLFSVHSYSNADWATSCQLSTNNYVSIVGFSRFRFVTELVDEIWWTLLAHH